MTIALRDLTTLDAAVVAQNLSEVTARVQEDNPTLDLRFGVLHNLLAYYHAVLEAQLDANVKDYLSARSLIDIQADPTLADPDTVDGVLSNFGLFRYAGTVAQGEVAIVLSTNTIVTLSLGTTFEADGQIFQTDQVYAAKNDPAQINDASDRLLTLLQDGTYVFTITVFAQAVGSAGLLKKDTPIVPTQLPSHYLRSYVVSDFTEGRNTETNQELINRLQQGIAAKTLSNRVNMNAFLRSITAYSAVPVTSVIGYGDPEMHRDRHTIFPVSYGGRADWYIRSQDDLFHLALSKTASLVRVNNDGSGLWQFNVSRDDAPGFYEVANIRRADAENVIGGFTINSDARALDFTGLTGFVPDIRTLAEGAYTRYQTAVIQFTDTVTPTTGLLPGATNLYTLEVRCLPLIGDIQDTINMPEVRSRGTDVLVKAPVPCFVQLSFKIVKRNLSADPDVAAIANALVHTVNTTGFTGTVSASTLQAVIAPYLSDGMSTGAIDMFGRIRYPNNSIKYIRSDETLQVPNSPANMVTPRTVQFFLDAADVGIAVVSAVPTNV